MADKIKVGFYSPSNIALVKYWGKIGEQLPMNPSLSFTLSKCMTQMEIEYVPSSKLLIDFYFENKLNEKFKEKIQKKLIRISSLFPWIMSGHFIIHSSNSFPHSSGIASSASSMSALALCLVELDQKINNTTYNNFEKVKMVSNLARLCSGSASRSVYNLGSIWGKVDSIENSSDEYAIEFNTIHADFNEMQDAILIIDGNEKSVSSTAGHELMINHPYRESRIRHARENLNNLIISLRDGDFKRFSEIVENEALDLHSMMMTSTPSFILLAPHSISAINLIREFRAQSNVQVTFTIDAGPNIHVLYTKKDKTEVEKFLNEKILKTNIAKEIIWDQIGDGPKEIRYE